MNLKRLAKRALATLSLSMLCLIAFAQGHQISGTVIDGTGEPILTVISNSAYSPMQKSRYHLSVISRKPLQWAARRTLR